MLLKSLARDLAQPLNRRPSSKPLNNNWLTGFFKCWKNRLRSLDPKSLKACRAKGSIPEIIESYCNKLDYIFEKYHLKDKIKVKKDCLWKQRTHKITKIVDSV